MFDDKKNSVSPPNDLPVDDAELTMLEMHIGDIVSAFANLSE